MYFSKALVVLSVAVSALASPHVARGVHHRDIAHRAAMPEAAPEPIVVPSRKIKKRADTNRCKVRSSSSAAPAATTYAPSPTSQSSSAAPTTSINSSSVIVPPKNVESDPTTSQAPEPTTSAAPEPTTTEKPHTTQKPTTTKQQTTAKPTTTQSSGGSGNDPLGILTGDKSGDGVFFSAFLLGEHVSDHSDGPGTFYATGLGSCGITNSDSDYIVAVSHELYDKFP